MEDGMKLKIKHRYFFILIMGLGLGSTFLSGCDKNVNPKEKDHFLEPDQNAENSNRGDIDTHGNPHDSKYLAEENNEKPEETIPMEKSPLTLKFSQISGVYNDAFSLELSCTEDSIIYYTTDGSNPITSSSRIEYQSPIPITDRKNDENSISAMDPFLYDAANVNVNKTRDGFINSINSTPSKNAVDKCTLIRAVAQDKDGLYTEVVTNTYFVGAMTEHIKGIQESCQASGSKLAIMSISMNQDDLFDPEYGIYVKGNIYENALEAYLSTGKRLDPETSRQLDANYKQKGRQWERNAHIDFFESDGSTTSLGLQQDCGIRIQGNYSRSDLQKGFRLFARKDYGNKNFNYPFFGEELKDDRGYTITRFKTLVLRNGGNTAFTTKFSDTYWQSLVKDLACETQSSRPCIVYLNGEYWGLYVLQEDYSQEYFEFTHGVNKDDVVLYKGDAEALALGYKLDEGKLPDGVTDESYYFYDLLEFFHQHKDLSNDDDYEEFAKLVDIESARDYFAIQIWINNKWDWPGKNWSLWRTTRKDPYNPYGDGRWRFCIYDVEFGGVSGASDARTNTIKEDNYKPLGLLDMDTNNPAVLIYAYLMTNENFRDDFSETLLSLSQKQFRKERALAALDVFKNTYGPLYDQFFERYPGSGSADNSIYGPYASYQCIKDFLQERARYIQPMLDYVDWVYRDK